MNLPLPSSVTATEIAPEILLFPRVISWGTELIRDANRINMWKQSTQKRSLSTESAFTGDYRNSSGVVVGRKTHPDFGLYEDALQAAIHACARVYVQYNKFVQINIDTGYELLRYEVGQHFHEHVDIIVGADAYVRQVSCVVLLNEDFEGGSLVFPRQGVNYKPRLGDIILFPSNFCYPHAVTDVTQGVRYSIVSWLSGDMRFPVTR